MAIRAIGLRKGGCLEEPIRCSMNAVMQISNCLNLVFFVSKFRVNNAGTHPLYRTRLSDATHPL